MSDRVIPSNKVAERLRTAPYMTSALRREGAEEIERLNALVLERELAPAPAASRQMAERWLESLGTYAAHAPLCASRVPHSPPRGFTRRPCSCGLDALIEQLSREATAAPATPAPPASNQRTRRLTFGHVNGEGEIWEDPAGPLTDWDTYEALRQRFERACARITELESAGETTATPVAYVPLHPRTGPLWANTVPSLDTERPAHYPVMALYATGLQHETTAPHAPSCPATLFANANDPNACTCGVGTRPPRPHDLACPLREPEQEKTPTLAPPTSNQRTVLQELVNTAAEVYRISERATLPWHALAAALKDARAALAQPDETTARHPDGCCKGLVLHSNECSHAQPAPQCLYPDCLTQEPGCVIGCPRRSAVKTS